MKPGIWTAWLKWRRSSPPCRAFISSAILFTESACRTASSPRGWRWSRLLPAFHSLPRFSFGCFRGRLRPEFRLRFFRQLFQDQSVGMLNQFFDFRLAQRVYFDHRHPAVSRHVWRRNDAFHFHQFRKLLRRAFEGDLRRAHAGLKVCDAKDFSRDTKEQVVLPLNVLGGIWKRETKGAHPVNVRSHRENIAARRDAGNLRFAFAVSQQQECSAVRGRLPHL